MRRLAVSLALYLSMATLDNSPGTYRDLKAPKHVNFVQALEVEQASGEALFGGGEGFGGVGYGAYNGPRSSKRYPQRYPQRDGGL